MPCDKNEFFGIATKFQKDVSKYLKLNRIVTFYCGLFFFVDLPIQLFPLNLDEYAATNNRKNK